MANIERAERLEKSVLVVKVDTGGRKRERRKRGVLLMFRLQYFARL